MADINKTTIKTIAKAASVSTATVSKALNDMPDISQTTKIKIRSIARELGYTINENASRLAGGHSFWVGVILPDISCQYSAEVYKSISSRLMRIGCSVYLIDSGNNVSKEQDYVMQMMQKRVDALIIMPLSNDIRYIEGVVRNSIPVIYIGSFENLLAANAVMYNDYYGGKLAARYLFRLGHRNVALFSNGTSDSIKQQRARGFVEYMQSHGAYIQVENVAALSDSEEAGRFLTHHINKSCTAIFATDDFIAFGAISELIKQGRRVPYDISVIGYGDSPCAGLSLINLTTISLPRTELGICAADMAVELLKGNDEILKRVILEPHLIKRGTVAKNET